MRDEALSMLHSMFSCAISKSVVSMNIGEIIHKCPAKFETNAFCIRELNRWVSDNLNQIS